MAHNSIVLHGKSDTSIRHVDCMHSDFVLIMVDNYHLVMAVMQILILLANFCLLSSFHLCVFHF